MKRLTNPQELEQLRQSIITSRDPKQPWITICGGTGCLAGGCEKVAVAFQQEVVSKGLKDKVSIRRTGCHGFCERGPIVVIKPAGIFYQCVTPEDVPEIITKTVLNKETIDRLLYTDPATGEKIVYEKDVPFYKRQQRYILAHNGDIDPTSIEDYLAVGGCRAISKALSQMSPEVIIDSIKKSGLRGRGGAGFPTGVKWEFCRKATDDEKFVICNADEGDPGAYMDRSILEGNPHSVLEGMLIGAFAIGSNSGIIYVRNEYPLAIDNLIKAVHQAQSLGLLGRNILDSGFNFSVKISRGAGAFVCGEETSLMASVEGKTGEPRQRPPFPAQRGLWNKPTNINNVETWASVPLIINNGWEWYAKIGTEKSKGTKVFSVVGKINNTGLVEVPMGTTLRQIVYDIGGGIPNNRRFKAVQTGGPSGGCIPQQLLDLPVDYERLTEAGAIMGSGGMIVMDERTCMVDMARYFLNFLKDESCGKCVACREGIQRMLEILTNITEGRGKLEDIELLEEIGTVVKDFALCALGGTAPNPVLSTLRYFRDEYEAHIKYKRCPAYVCKKIISSPCQHVCPLGTDVPAYVTLIAQGQFSEALDVIRKTNPLVSICGRVCHHPCEAVCSAGEGGEPIAIRVLKRVASDYGRRPPVKRPPEVIYEKVAIIGAGPAGLTGGYYLAKQGYNVTIFEAMPEAGGMLRYAIPEYRLPKEALWVDLNYIKESGVTIQTNTRVGIVARGDPEGTLQTRLRRDITFEELTKKFKAIFIATGAHQNLRLGIHGEEAQGVINPIEFLKSMRISPSPFPSPSRGEGRERVEGRQATTPLEIGPRVVVIGGGNVAIDAARSAWRQGKNAIILYRRTRAEMPANPEEIEEALKEGIEIQFLVAPTRIITEHNRVIGLECIRMKLGEPDASGRRKPIPIEGSEFKMEIDTLIPAIGQEPDTSFLPSSDGLKFSRQKTVEVDTENLVTGRVGVFAGGDVVLGPATVTQAMAQGKLAAESIHKYLRRQPLTRSYEVTRPSVEVEPIKLSEAEQEELLEAKRPETPSLIVSNRKGNFKEVEFGYTKELAIAEAKRCLRCDRQ